MTGEQRPCLWNPLFRRLDLLLVAADQFTLGDDMPGGSGQHGVTVRPRLEIEEPVLLAGPAESAAPGPAVLVGVRDAACWGPQRNERTSG